MSEAETPRGDRVSERTDRGGFDHSHTEDTEVYQPVTQVVRHFSSQYFFIVSTYVQPLIKEYLLEYALFNKQIIFSFYLTDGVCMQIQCIN